MLSEKYSLDRFSRILDLGCGTGQIALPISNYAGEIIAIDPQEDMLVEGRQIALANGIKNIQWVLGESGNLPQMAGSVGKINLTVIARAFHWMDKEQVLQDLYALTKPGGGVAIIWDSELRAGVKLPWKEVIDRVIWQWLGNNRKAGIEGTFTHPLKRFDVFLKESDFQEVETEIIQLERIWTIDQIIGYLYSTSYCSPPILGSNKESFENDLRTCLGKLDSSEHFIDQVSVEIITAFKKPSELIEI